MNYYSHVFYFPTTPPFDKPEFRLQSFVGGFVAPIVAANPGLIYWFSYYTDHAKFRVYTNDYEAIRPRIEAERDRLGLVDSGREKDLTLIEDIGGGRFIGPDSSSNPQHRVELLLNALCANANLIVDSVFRRDDGYWQIEETKDQQNPNNSPLFSVNHLYHNMSGSRALVFLFERDGKPEVKSYYNFFNDPYCASLDQKDFKYFWINL